MKPFTQVIAITVLTYVIVAQAVCAAELPCEAFYYVPPIGCQRFGLLNDPGDNPFSQDGPGCEYLASDQHSSIKFQLSLVRLPVGNPKPMELKSAILAALSNRLDKASAGLSNRSAVVISSQTELAAVSISGVIKMSAAAPFQTALMEMRWIHIESNLVLKIMALSPSSNVFLALTNSVGSLKIDKTKMLQSINPLFLSPFAPSDIQFEGKSIETWLEELIGVSETSSRRLSEETQNRAIEAIRRMSGREFDYMAESLPSAKTDRLLYEAIVHTFKAAPTNAIPTIPKLIKLLGRDDATANGAVRCLSFIGSPSIPALLQALTDKSAKVRGNAVNALGKIGPPAKDAIPALLNLSKDTDSIVRQSAAFALKQIGYNSSVPK